MQDNLPVFLRSNQMGITVELVLECFLNCFVSEEDLMLIWCLTRSNTVFCLIAQWHIALLFPDPLVIPRESFIFLIFGASKSRRGRQHAAGPEKCDEDNEGSEHDSSHS
jgi:hypothetical protein